MLWMGRYVDADGGNDMDKKIETAIDNISLIKAVIEKTQEDFSRVSSYFIWIGIINMGTWILADRRIEL